MLSVIYNVKIVSRQKHSISHAPIHLTDKIREEVGSGNLWIIYSSPKNF